MSLQERQPGSLSALRMVGSGFVHATLDCSTKNLTKASAPSAVCARAAAGMSNAVVGLPDDDAVDEPDEGAVDVLDDDAADDADDDADDDEGEGGSSPPVHPAVASVAATTQHTAYRNGRLTSRAPLGRIPAPRTHASLRKPPHTARPCPQGRENPQVNRPAQRTTRIRPLGRDAPGSPVATSARDVNLPVTTRVSVVSGRRTP